jgi:hypothetical protein
MGLFVLYHHQAFENTYFRTFVCLGSSLSTLDQFVLGWFILQIRTRSTMASYSALMQLYQNAGLCEITVTELSLKLMILMCMQKCMIANVMIE